METITKAIRDLSCRIIAITFELENCGKGEMNDLHNQLDDLIDELKELV